LHGYLLGHMETGGHSCLQMVRARSSFEPLRGEARREAFRSEANRLLPVAGTSRAISPGLLNPTNQLQGLPEVSSKHFGDAAKASQRETPHYRAG
jgi:hypothetical protein